MVGRDDNGDGPPEWNEIQDDENYVDKRVKDRIMQVRGDVDKWWSELFMMASMGDIGPQEATRLWHEHVRRYLVAIEPLLRNDDELPQAAEFYEEAELGKVMVEPPEELREQTGIPAPGNVSEVGALVQSEPPDPKKETIRGLKSVIERDSIRKTWTVRVRDVNGAGPSVQDREFEQTVPLPRDIVLNAVRTADEFLQQAGVGVHTKDEIDTHAEPF